MGIKARYDGREDRMLLVFEADDGSRRALWVTRRQWLNLLSVLGPPKPEEEEVTAAKAPAARAQPLPDSITSGAQQLDSIRFSRKDEAVQLGFVVGDQPIGLALHGDSLERMKQMVQQQAERAGWDPEAAIVRMRAGAAASTAMRKAAG